MNDIFVIGNGESRKNIDLNKLNGITIGCNAIYRDFSPDYLFSVDKRMIFEICNSDYPKENICFFRDWQIYPEHFFDESLFVTKRPVKDIFKTKKTSERDHFCIYHVDYNFINKDYIDIYLIWVDKNSKINIIPKKSIWEDMWDSGPSALHHACAYLEPENIYLLGFDIYSNNDKVNNLYKDTNCYVKSDTNSVNPSNWIKQIDLITDKFNHVNFTWLDATKKIFNKPNIKYEESKWHNIQIQN